MLVSSTEGDQKSSGAILVDSATARPGSTEPVLGDIEQPTDVSPAVGTVDQILDKQSDNLGTSTPEQVVSNPVADGQLQMAVVNENIEICAGTSGHVHMAGPEKHLELPAGVNQEEPAVLVLGDIYHAAVEPSQADTVDTLTIEPLTEQLHQIQTGEISYK